MRHVRAARRALRGLPALVAVAALVAGGGLSAVRGSGAAAAAPDRQPEPGREEVGALLYGRDCAGCHGDGGEGSPRGVPLTDAGEAAAHYVLVTGRMPIDDPDQVPERGPSPYAPDEIDALVDHVAGLGDGPALPRLEWEDADVSQGGVLYRLHCGACHGATAVGGALAYERTAPGLQASEPSVVAAAVVSGPGAMPAFAPLGLTDQELASIVAYTQEIQDPVDRGGWPIFRTGRPDEALVTWVLAVPALLAGAAWLARRPR